MPFQSLRSRLAAGLLVASLVLLTACGAAAEPPPAAQAPAATPTPPRASATPDPAPEESPVEERDLPTPEAPEEVLVSVRQAVAETAQVAPGEVTVVETTPEKFSNTALGCPEPDTMYAEVITPGYIVVATANGERFEYHTDVSGDLIVRCEKQPVATDRAVEEADVPVSEPLVQDAIELVSSQTGLPTAELTVVEAEQVEWPDAGLGCGQPGQMYMQVITPGYRLVVESEAGEQFAVHTDLEGDNMILCTAEVRGRDLPEAAVEAPPAVQQAAMEAVANVSALAADTLEIVSAEAVEWSDASLGCPQPGMMYAQVITPGYRLTVQGGDQVYEVHTDQQGRTVICNQ